jgi:hypothetical protein
MESSDASLLHVDGRCTGLPVRRALGFWARAAGLWAVVPDGSPRALELRPCAAVHTLGLPGAIDVVFVDADGVVLRAVSSLRAWRVAWARRAAATWELPAGACEAHGVRPGARLHAMVRGSAALAGAGSATVCPASAAAAA